MSITRRQFVQKASVAAASVGLPAMVSSRVFGANEELRVGVVGLGIRGTGAHIPGMAMQKGVAIVAVCDPDRTRSAAAAKSCERRYRRKPDQYVDVRKLLERNDIDVVCVATQQYWHALGAIWACQAGKHVYVEKPASHYIWEGRQMVNAARRYNRIVQCGTQQRSNNGTRAAIEWIRAGNLGKIKLVTAFANKPRVSVGKRDQPLRIRPKSTTISGAARPRSCRSTATNSSTIAASIGTPATANRPIKGSTRSTSPAGSWAKKNCRGG